jgi:hypothetical protein
VKGDGRIGLGSALQDDEPDEDVIDAELLPAAALVDTAGPEPGDESNAAASDSSGHLCPGCGHVQVCGIAAAIIVAGMGAGAAGDIVVSKCGEFVSEYAFRAALDRMTTPAEEQRAASESSAGTK